MSRSHDAFISYGRADSKEFAKKLHDRLAQQGLDVWFDFNDIPLGVDYQNQIDEGIEKADNFLFIIAPHSVNSPYCGKEVELALKLNKRIIPLLHVEQIGREVWQQRFPVKGDAEWQDYIAQGKHSSFPNMHPEIAKINWIYCREGIDDFEQAFQGLQALLGRQQPYVRQHTLFLSRALEWERQQKQSRYLLVGDDRQQAEAWLRVRFKEEQPPCVPTDLHCEFITESVKNSQNLTTQVFISYAEEEIAVMEQVRRSLRREGFTVWTNKTDIQTGVDFQEAIKRGVEEADNLVYLLSPSALQSTYCQEEIDYALSLNKRIIPLLVQPTDLEQVPPTLRNLQYIDLTDNTIELDYQQDESELLRTLRQDAVYYEEHKVLLTRALKWERQHQNPSVLLRGYNLQHAEAWLKVAKSRSQHRPLPIQEEFIAASLQQPPGISLDVFVSYSRADSDFARRLNDALQVQGKTTWFDQESIASGTDFQKEIYRGIENSNNFLFVISPNAISSPYCADEVEYAQKLNKRIVTILHRPVNPADLHPVLAAVQWIDFDQRDGDFSANFKEVLRTIDTDPVHLQSHTRLLVRAIEWDSKERKESLLLRGDDLEDAEQWVAQSVNRDPKPTSLQQDYVKSSRSAEAANRQASQILEAAAKKGQQRVLVGTTVMAIGLAIAGIAGGLAFKAQEQAKAAETKAKEADTQAQDAKQQEQSSRQQALIAKDQVAKAEVREKQAQVRLNQASIAVKAAEQQKQVAEQQVTLAEEKLQTASEKTAQAEQQFQQAQQQIALAQRNLDQARVAKREAEVAQKEAQIGTALEREGANTLRQFETEQLNALVAAVRLGKALQGITKDDRSLAQYPTTSPLLVLQTILDNIQEQTRIELPFPKDGFIVPGLSFINSASFSPNGQQIVTAGETKTAYLWDLQGKQLAALEGHQDNVKTASFSADGSQIVTISTDGTVRIWDLSGRLIRELKRSQTEIKLASFSPDGQRLVTASTNGNAQIWEISSGLMTEFKLQGKDIDHAAFSPDGQRIVTASSRETQIWDLSGREIAKLNGSLSKAGLSPDGKYLITVTKNTAQVWDFSGNRIAELKGHQGSINDAQFSSDSRWMITASDDATIRAWNLAGEEIGQFRGRLPAVKTARFSPDRQRIFATTDDGALRIWNVSSEPPLSGVPMAGGVETDTSIAVIKGARVNINTAQFSPDGQRLLAWSISDKTAVWIWDVSERQLLLLQRKALLPGSLSSPSGQQLLTIQGNVVQLSNATGKLIAELKGHQDRIKDANFSPDGQRIVTASNDRTVRVWDLTGRPVAELRVDQGLSSVSFSQDGQRILLSDYNGKVRAWRADNLNQLVSRGCRWLSSYLKNSPGLSESDRHLCDDELAAPQKLK